MKNIDLTALSLQDALDLAILIEEEAMERYQELAEQMETHHTSEAAQFYRSMVVNETRHRDELASRRVKLFGDAPRRVNPLNFSEVEAPEYEKVRAFMSVRQALEVALESEKKAHAYFVDAVKHVTDSDVRELFRELQEEEVMHQNMIRKQLEKAPVEPVDAGDYADEPVAQ